MLRILGASGDFCVSSYFRFLLIYNIVNAHHYKPNNVQFHSFLYMRLYYTLLDNTINIYIVHLYPMLKFEQTTHFVVHRLELRTINKSFTK